MKRRGWSPDGPEVERVRRVRRQLERQFPSPEAFWDHFEKLDRQRRVARRKKVSKKLARAS